MTIAKREQTKDNEICTSSVIVSSCKKENTSARLEMSDVAPVQNHESLGSDKKNTHEKSSETDVGDVAENLMTLSIAAKDARNVTEQRTGGEMKTVEPEENTDSYEHNTTDQETDTLETTADESLFNSSTGKNVDPESLKAGNKDTENINCDENSKNLPIDKGWAWVILFAAYLEVFIFGGMMKCSGIFFIAYQERFESSASETAMILTVQNMTMSFTGIFIMTIGMKYLTARTLILIGAMLQPIFYIVTAFAENIGVLYFTVGFIPGLAGAVIYLPIMATINIYFNKYRGLANSISMSGSSLGGLVFGPIYTALFEEYGYTGTLLILSGIFLNILITGVLMRPMEFYTKHNKKETHASDKDDCAIEKLIDKEKSRKTTNAESRGMNASAGESSSEESAYVSEDESSPKEVKSVKDNHNLRSVKRNQNAFDDTPIVRKLKHREFGRTVSYDPESLSNRHFPSPSLKRMKLGYHGSYSAKSSESVNGPRKRTISELSHGKVIHDVVETLNRSSVALYSSGDVICTSLIAVNVIDHDEVFSKEGLEKQLCEPENSKLGRAVVDFFKTVFDISLLKSYVFIHYLCFAFFVLPGSVLPSVYFAPYSKEIEITSSEIGTMFSIIGFLDMLSRIAVGLIADRKWMRPTSILCLTSIIVGTMCHFIRFFTSYETMTMFVVIIGVTSGAYMSLYAVVILEHMGVEHFKGALGWAVMCHGVTMAAFFPITGTLRDETGTYFASFHLIGVTLYLAAVLAFSLPLTSRRCSTTSTSQVENSIKQG